VQNAILSNRKHLPEHHVHRVLSFVLSVILSNCAGPSQPRVLPPQPGEFRAVLAISIHPGAWGADIYLPGPIHFVGTSSLVSRLSGRIVWQEMYGNPPELSDGRLAVGSLARRGMALGNSEYAWDKRGELIDEWSRNEYDVTSLFSGPNDRPVVFVAQLLKPLNELTNYCSTRVELILYLPDGRTLNYRPIEVPYPPSDNIIARVSNPAMELVLFPT